jgi:hypothetical protein
MTQHVVIVNDDEETLTAAGGAMAPLRRRVASAEIFPLLALPFGLFALLNLTVAPGALPWYRAEVFHLSHMSGDVWLVSCSDLFLSLSMLLLFVEIVRSTRRGGEPLLNHVFSAFVFIGALIMFITQPGYGNSTFVIFMAMTALDFMAGFIITAVAWRRDTIIGPMM